MLSHLYRVTPLLPLPPITAMKRSPHKSDPRLPRLAKRDGAFSWAHLASRAGADPQTIRFQSIPLFDIRAELGRDRAGPDPKTTEEERYENLIEATRRSRTPGQVDDERPSYEITTRKGGFDARGCEQ